MKDELNFPYNGGGDAYLLQSVSIHFNHTVVVQKQQFRRLFGIYGHTGPDSTSALGCVILTVVSTIQSACGTPPQKA